MKFTLSRVESPLGELSLVTDDHEQVRALNFSDQKAHLNRSLRKHYERYATAELVDATAPKFITDAFQSYFAGDLMALDSLPTAINGNELQNQVWAALRHIPAGKTKSYGEVARDLGYTDPRMAIDIGAANGANPIAIMVPCHRVIAKNGDLKGYAWGVHRKRWLLEHEGALPRMADVANSTPSLPGF
jgi:methylated-DNA-[protein]-cysteine S-methyltransferase